jgi:hypothetical protein
MCLLACGEGQSVKKSEIIEIREKVSNICFCKNTLDSCHNAIILCLHFLDFLKTHENQRKPF